MKRIFLSTVLGLAVLASCNSGGEKAPATPEKPAVEETKPEEPVVVEETTDATANVIELESNDKMQFNKAEIKVKAGQEVTLKLVHTGKMPKEAMGHNFVLLAQGTDLAEFAQKAMAAKATDYIPAGDAVLAHTKVIGGGESDEITFTAPAVGTYDFICSFPGHYSIMKGKFIVE